MRGDRAPLQGAVARGAGRGRQHARPIRRKRGEAIHRPGDDVSHLLVVHRGRVKISHLAPNGHEQLLRVLEPGDFIGETAFVTGSRPDDWAMALSDVELCSFDHSDLAGLVAQYPDIAVRMLHAVTSRLDAAERLIADLTSADVESRLAGYLMGLPRNTRTGGSSCACRWPRRTSPLCSARRRRR